MPSVCIRIQVVAEQISTRDLVQEYLANKTSPTLSEFSMPKLKGTKKPLSLCDCPIASSLRNSSKSLAKNGWRLRLCAMKFWVIIPKKEDQLMTAAFGTRSKRRLNRVMDALNFEYPDYE
jgi:hypothetical protein